MILRSAPHMCIIPEPLFECLGANCTHTAEELGEECPDETEAEQEILATIMSDYNKQTLPTKLGITANVELHVNDIPSLSELESEFTLDLMYSEMWRDLRLKYSDMSNVTLDLDYLKKLWTPNTCIVNSKSAIIHSSPSENVFLILYNTGTVWKNCRMMVRAPCKIDLRQFPFDKQSCELVFESYSYNSQKVGLQWYKDAPITLVQKNIQLPDFTLVKWEANHYIMEYPNGNWDQLKATFFFKRRYGFFILQAYVPTYMTIFVAWISFWMDPKELSTRATLGISAFLAITLQFGNILKNQPPVSYVKALDIWMLACITFLFAALAELAIVSYMMRTDKPSKQKRKLSNNNNSTSSNHLLREEESVQHTKLEAKKRCRINFKAITPYKVDRFCMLAFIPFFLAFNLVYWFYIVGIENF